MSVETSNCYVSKVYYRYSFISVLMCYKEMQLYVAYIHRILKQFTLTIKWLIQTHCTPQEMSPSTPSTSIISQCTHAMLADLRPYHNVPLSFQCVVHCEGQFSVYLPLPYRRVLHRYPPPRRLDCTTLSVPPPEAVRI